METGTSRMGSWGMNGKRVSTSVKGNSGSFLILIGISTPRLDIQQYLDWSKGAMGIAATNSVALRQCNYPLQVQVATRNRIPVAHTIWGSWNTLL